MSTPVVTFVYADWIQFFPAMRGVQPVNAQAFFDMGDFYFGNDPSNPAYCGDLPRFTRLAYLVTCHLAMLLSPKDANGNPVTDGQVSPLVGRINSASEGSVSVGVELKGGDSPSEAFFTQTQYGFMFWQATAQFRTMRSVPNPNPYVIVPPAPGGYRRGWR